MNLPVFSSAGNFFVPGGPVARLFFPRLPPIFKSLENDTIQSIDDIDTEIPGQG
jgi:hypothetical protein